LIATKFSGDALLRQYVFSWISVSPDGESGGMLTHSPRHPPRYPAARPYGFAALLDQPGTRANSLRSDTAHAFFPAALCYSPAQMGIFSPCMG